MDSSWSGLVPSSEERHHKRQAIDRGVAKAPLIVRPQTARVAVVTESSPVRHSDMSMTVRFPSAYRFLMR
jgi:hypothetical protein